MRTAARITGVLVFCLVAGCGRQVMQEEPSVASYEIPVIQRAEELGKQIYTQDLYAAQASGLLLVSGLDPTEIGAFGWITESRPNGAVVTFVTGDPQQWRSVCVVTFAGHEDPNIILINKDLDETQAAMFNARQLALEHVEKVCSDEYNTVVLPRAGEPGWLAYALAATSDPNLILVGGHYRVTTSADGRTVLDRRAFTKDCMVLEKPQPSDPRIDFVAYTVRSALDKTPTEIHVMLSLLYGQPLCVVTSDRRLWYIEGGKIRLLRRP